MLFFRRQKKVTVADRAVGLKRNVKFENNRKWHKCNYGIQVMRSVSSILYWNEALRSRTAERIREFEKINCRYCSRLITEKLFLRNAMEGNVLNGIIKTILTAFTHRDPSYSSIIDIYPNKELSHSIITPFQVTDLSQIYYI